MKKSSVVLIAAAVVGLSASPNASAVMDLAAVGGASLTSSSAEAGGISLPSSRKSGYLAGALLSFSTIPMLFDLQIGALWGQRSVSYQYAAFGVEYSGKVLHVPVLLRTSFLPLVSIGAGAYMNKMLGQTTLKTTAGGLTTETTQSYDAAGMSTTDVGLALAVGAKKELAPALSFIVDGRYLMSLTNFSNQALVTVKTREFQALFGLSVGI